MVSKDLSMTARSVRMRLLPDLVLTNSAMTSRHVRLIKLSSAAAKYVLAICRFSFGCRTDSFLEWSKVRASASFLVRKLNCLPVVVSSQ